LILISGTEIEIIISSKNVFPLIYFLNKHSLCRFKSMIDIICYDTLGKSYRFFLVYNLLSVAYNMRIRIITKINETGKLLSLISLYRSVGWSEREIFDFFGLFFFENKDLRKILTDYGFKGFPLRKDFPLTGYIDVYYDDNQKCICYKYLELNQEYRNFKFISGWKIQV
jgi:NADH:ubiquinone oxidoreductase subunit C